MNKDKLGQLLLSVNEDDNKIAMEIIISKSKDYATIRQKLFRSIGFDGGYISVQLPLQFGAKAAELLLNHPITNT